MRALLSLLTLVSLSLVQAGCTHEEAKLGSGGPSGRTTQDPDPSDASRGITGTARIPTQPNAGNERADEHMLKNYGPSKTDEPERAE